MELEKIKDSYAQSDVPGSLSDSVGKNLSLVSIHRNDFSAYLEGVDNSYRDMKARKELPVVDESTERRIKSLYVKVGDSIETLVDIRHVCFGGTWTSDRIENFLCGGTPNVNFQFTFVGGSKSYDVRSYVSVGKSEVLILIDPEYLHILPDDSELIVIYENKRVRSSRGE